MQSLLRLPRDQSVYRLSRSLRLNPFYQCLYFLAHWVGYFGWRIILRILRTKTRNNDSSHVTNTAREETELWHQVSASPSLSVVLPPSSLLKDKQFSVLRKCRSKFDCLIFEVLFIKKLKPGLNSQKDSICAKLFTWHWVQIYSRN